MRTKKILYNTMTGFLYEAMAAFSGLVISRLILSRFGSDYNGVIASITQFISYISLFAAGVGGVTQAALYKPLADGDNAKISGIMRATSLFMRKIAFVFVIGLAVLALVYPALVGAEFDWFFIFTLVLIIGTGIFVQYFFEITYMTLVIADQRGYVLALVRIFAIVLSTAASAVLILADVDIRVVKLVSAVIFMMVPAFIYLYVRKRYKLLRSVEPDNSAIGHRWNAFVDQVSWFIYNNFDLVLITVFASMKEASVYTVYYGIICMIRLLITSFGGSNISAPFGSMLANGEHENMKNSVRLYEFVINTLSTVLFVCAAVLIVPFISVYTHGVTDTNYYRPLFAYLVCASEFATVFSFPYCTPVLAAGHYRQIRNDAVWQIGINVVLSVILVQYFGLVGVIAGKLCAMAFRTARYILYMSRHIVRRSLWIAVRNLLVCILSASVIIGLVQFLPKMTETTYLAWLLYAISVFGVAAGVTAVFSGLFYRKEVRMLMAEIRLVTHSRQDNPPNH